MEKSSNHLCELLSPCCLELISKSVVLEILRVFISILFFSILIEIVSLMIFSVITYFYPSLCDKGENNEIILNNNEPQSSSNNVSEKSGNLTKSKLSYLFEKSNDIIGYNFNF